MALRGSRSGDTSTVSHRRMRTKMLNDSPGNRHWARKSSSYGARVDHPNGVVASGDSLRLRFRFRANVSVPRFRLGGTVFRVDGLPVGSWFTEHTAGLSKGEEADYTVHASGLSLAPGKYYLGASTGRGDHLTGHVDFDVILNFLNFEVRPPEGDGGTVAYWPPGWGSVVFQPPTIKRAD